MTFHIVIPARYASTRLPGKPLSDLAGKPMIQRVYECACNARAKSVTVATDDQRIAEAVEQFGGKVCLTRADHASGTDRLQEVVARMGLADDEIVVNVQGDEPLIPAVVINQVADNLGRFTSASAATLCESITEVKPLFDPNVVKVVRDMSGMALYFSRAPIPWRRERPTPEAQTALPPGMAYRHIGLYAYRVALLHEFVQWPMAELENIEKLEQLRILANGHRIHVDDAVVRVPGGVDTAEDLQRIREQLGE